MNHTLLWQLQHFPGHHPFQTILLAMVAGVIADKAWYLVRHRSTLKLGTILRDGKLWLHLGAALAGLGTVGHTLLTEAAGVLDTICK